MNYMGLAGALALPETLKDPIKGPSQSPHLAARTAAIGTDLSYFEWMHQQMQPSDAGVTKASGSATNGLNRVGEVTSNKELLPRDYTEMYILALAAYSRSRGRALLYDFPWNELGDALIVDVGGGVALESRRAQLMVHDFFTPNLVKGADVYFMRNVLHDWNDEDCIRILSKTAEAMGANSRLLIAGINLISILGDPYAVSPPKPLLGNYGVHGRHGYALDMSMMILMNGRERTSDEHRELFGRAGLKMVKFWDCRSALSITECRLA